jgi:hypothetical protein
MYGGSAPKPPDYGPLMEMQKELGNRYLDQADRQFALEQERYAELSPYAKQIMQSQIEGQNLAMQQAREAFDFQTNTLRPMQHQFIDDARNFNTEAKREELAGQAGGDTEQALAIQRSAAMRQLERMGVNPNSGRFAALMSDSGLGAARMRAGAMNNARTAARQEGHDRLMKAYGVASGNAAYGLNALQGANASGANATVSMGAADRVAQGYTNAGMQGLQGYGGTLSATGNLMNQDYQNRMYGYNADNQMWGGIGQLGGMAMGYFSSEKMKTDNAPVDEDAVLQKVKALPVEEWRYNSGTQRHVGPYAEDVQKRFGNDVAPGGQMIDAVSMNGINLAATKALAKKVDRLEQLMKPRAMAAGGMVRGPGTGTSDEIPAVNQDTGQPIRLSNGEYVLPAATVRQIGVEQLDRIVTKTNGKPPVHRKTAIRRN